ncbi:flagellar motor switch protein FliN/FliY [Desulfohalotomaculum tongense]|uniref:flagellar motor switch phosphatase FliY n=1 Tax=Desulforadius tongensis TaxID=1216062 RepID=UPI00195D25DB|nr:flagellar motor switch phosphatase FliY [Desulforadius tongensis]MBM7854237.1 flagellar motor switch protein FliN/FliY [Desulforadius tongensis]
MTNDNLLNQEEIDMLMKAQMDDEVEGENEVLSAGETAADKTGSKEDVLTIEEKDALGEIGNISMGSASTTLSELLGQKVNITSPRVWVASKRELIEGFTVPYLSIKVDFIEGIEGFNLLIMKLPDALVIANLMMGGDGSPEHEELTEMEVSAASEAMNMMIGAASTSLSQMFDKTINISPPEPAVLKDQNDAKIREPLNQISDDTNLVIVSFKMTIGDLVDTEIMQIMGVETAREQASLLLQSLGGTEMENPEPPAEKTEIDSSELNEIIDSLPAEQEKQPGAAQPAAAPQPAAQVPGPGQYAGEVPRNLDLILDIPLKVQVILGRTKKPIKEVLNVGPGTVLELDSLADEPVEILVNGTLVAEGEVVVVNENFGVKITNIISPTERIQRLAGRN